MVLVGAEREVGAVDDLRHRDDRCERRERRAMRGLRRVVVKALEFRHHHLRRETLRPAVDPRQPGEPLDQERHGAACMRENEGDIAVLL
jgi:hypothetical protein